MRFLFSLVLLFVFACGANQQAPSSSAPVILVGEVTRADLERAAPAWRQAAETSPIETPAAHALAEVPAGAEVTVYLGTWCGDSRREVSRFWRALDAAGQVPFSVRWIAVGRDKQAPEVTEALGLRYVPTFVVSRDGAEVGRVVESAPRGIETELNALLRGETSGVVSSRTDLQR